MYGSIAAYCFVKIALCPVRVLCTHGTVQSPELWISDESGNVAAEVPSGTCRLESTEYGPETIKQTLQSARLHEARVVPLCAFALSGRLIFDQVPSIPILPFFLLNLLHKGHLHRQIHCEYQWLTTCWTMSYWHYSFSLRI